MKFTRVSADVASQLQLNAGVILKSFQTSGGGSYNEEDILAATTGGVSISCTPTYSDLADGIDNCPTNILEFKRLDSVEITMSGTFVTVTKELLEYLVPQPKESSTSLDEVYVAKADGSPVNAPASYLWWVGDYTGKKNGFIAVKISNPISTSGFSLQSSDKGKASFPFTFVAHKTMEQYESESEADIDTRIQFYISV